MINPPKAGACPECGSMINQDDTCPNCDEPDIINEIDDAVEGGMERLDEGIRRILRR